MPKTLKKHLIYPLVQFPASGHENYLHNSRTEWEKAVEEFLKEN